MAREYVNSEGNIITIEIPPELKSMRLLAGTKFDCGEVTKSHPRQYMEQVIDQHIDFMTDIVNCTTLAEDAAEQFNVFEPNSFNAQEWVCDLAVDVADSFASD